MPFSDDFQLENCLTTIRQYVENQLLITRALSKDISLTFKENCYPIDPGF